MIANNIYNYIHSHIRSSVFTTFLLSFVLLAAAPAIAQDVPPVFTNGSPQFLSVCRNSDSININYLLTINAIINGQTETWSVSMPPTHGALGGFNTSDTTTDSALTPSGLTYTPATGYAGNDTFTIAVSNGVDTALTTIIVSVHPVPVLTSSLAAADICSGTAFSYTPMSGVAGASFTWRRAAVAGISNAASSGTGNINETLSSTTYYNVTATYIYTVAASGCSSTADIAVVVKPTPTLITPLHDTVCNGAAFMYTPSSLTAGAMISYSRAAVTGITPDSASGSGTITETLTNNTDSAVNTVYVFELTANGCSAVRDLTVTVEPPVPAIGITTAAPSSVCSNTLYQNFGTSLVPASGVTYTWTVNNAVIYARGANSQYILVNFNNPGTAVVTLTSNVPGTACNSFSSDTINVGSATATSATVIYDNTRAEFVYLDNTASSYQWGYDNNATLDSTAVPGATFQSYPDDSVDFTNNHYWLITSEGGCMEKTYYNPPLIASNISSVNKENMSVYPNPSGNIVNVDINGAQGTATVYLMDMMGKTVKTKSGTEHTMQFNVAELPAGCYIFSVYENGAKMNNVRFIKN